MILMLFAIILPVALGRLNNSHVAPNIFGKFRDHQILSKAHWRILQNFQQLDPVKEEDVTFSLVLKRNSSERIPLNEGTYDQINTRYPIQMIIHGWRENSSTPWVQLMTEKFLRIIPFNIIIVDYSRIAFQPRILASSNVGAVGELVGKFLVFLETNHSLPISRDSLIAFGLGAHVAGNAGREINKSGLLLNKIEALDAAKLLFECPPLFENLALKKSDARLLQAIHTDKTFFGYREPFGNMDFYPNDAVAPQPGCPSIRESITPLHLLRGGFDDLLCSHRRSYMYFISSLDEGRFEGTLCNSWRNFTSGGCDNNTRTFMGSYANIDLPGKYYLRTKPEYPYGEKPYSEL